MAEQPDPKDWFEWVGRQVEQSAYDCDEAGIWWGPLNAATLSMLDLYPQEQGSIQQCYQRWAGVLDAKHQRH